MLFRPLLFRLPFPLARNLCLDFMGRLARLPLGGSVIDFLGHMGPDPRLQTHFGGLVLSSPVVLGPFLDTRLTAPEALARFGLGAIEVGPVARESIGNSAAISREDRSQSLHIREPLPVWSVDELAERLSLLKLPLPLIIRLHANPGTALAAATSECEQSVAKLRNCAAAFALATTGEAAEQNWPVADWQQHVTAIVQVTRQDGEVRPLFLCVTADANDNAVRLASAAVEFGASGVIVEGRVRDNARGGWLVGGAALERVEKTVERLRRELGTKAPIIAGGAVDPAGALQLLAAGAAAVQIDAALAFSGPGLVKRINEAVLFARCHTTQRKGSGQPPKPILDIQSNVAAMSWFWALLLGVAMLGGGALAMLIACTRVVLPYDEQYLGMTAGQLTTEVNARLLAFMAHDRVTLAGTMLAVGIQYIFLAWFGIRRGQHWAKSTVVTSAFCGFGTFFLFLGFGYFDPFHAFVTAILFQFLLFAFQGRLATAIPPGLPHLHDDWRWRLAQWGQLLLIAEAIAVIAAGATICTIGSTSVFVPEDLEFMQTTAKNLRAANPRLVPVVAHDRASFGGMLLSVGLATLLPALWGIRQGSTWLWWMFALAGTIGYGATLAVHLHVGYTSPMHLAPAVGGLALLWLALALLAPLLATPTDAHRREWVAILERLTSTRDAVPPSLRECT
jgi:dihydroorotate dehydrogenase